MRSASDVAIDVGRVAVIGVLDEQPVRPERQQIDEAIAVDLGDGRVHHHRARQPVRRGQPQLLAEELLPAADRAATRSAGPRASITPSASIRMPSASTTARGADADRLAPVRMRSAGSARAHHRVEPLRGDRVIARASAPAMVGEDDVIAVPAMRDERHRPAARSALAMSLVEEGPDMVAAERLRRRRSAARAHRAARCAIASAISPPASPPPTIARSQLRDRSIGRD